MASRNSNHSHSHTNSMRKNSKKNSSNHTNASKENIFTIYTTGLANWGADEAEENNKRLIYYFNSYIK